MNNISIGNLIKLQHTNNTADIEDEKICTIRSLEHYSDKLYIVTFDEIDGQYSFSKEELLQMKADVSIQDYMESRVWLPSFMRDFHDMKTVFKAIEDGIVKNRIESHDLSFKAGNVNWCDAMAYTIDIFLWFMAEHGYTLQKVNNSLDRYDIQKTIKEWTELNSAKYSR
jgi:hypothetical protein